MKLNEYQDQAKTTARYPEVVAPYVYLALGLAGESGEVVEKLKKLVRNKEGDLTGFDVEGLKRELGDVLWYVSNLAEQFGFTLEEVAMANIEKLTDRQERGVVKSEGDDR